MTRTLLCLLLPLVLLSPSSSFGYSSTCPDPTVQRSLRYNCSGLRVPETLPQPASPNETLADAICCDPYYAALAEPKFLFESLGLFSDLHRHEHAGKVTFYDSACGLPVFVVPHNRTLEDFKADTMANGWPSFRDGELTPHVKVTAEGYVVSECGTHLGSHFKDEQGNRYCIDLVCVAGKPVSATQHRPRPWSSPLPPPPTEYVDLVTFDGADKTTFPWRDMNDPVMGGVSSSTFVISHNSSTAIFNGTVRIVPKLKAPGFCNAETSKLFAHFNDASAYTHLMLLVRTQTPSYTGFKVSFAADTLDPQFQSFKTNFNVTHADTWTWVSLRWDEFSNDWSPFTGDCWTKDPTGTQHHCCSKDHPEVCPVPKNLKDIEQVGLWTEGVTGDFHLEVARIGAGNIQK